MIYHLNTTQSQRLPRLHDRLPHGNRVDECAIGRSQITDGDDTVSEINFAVEARNAGIVDGLVVLLVSSHPIDAKLQVDFPGPVLPSVDYKPSHSGVKFGQVS